MRHIRLSFKDFVERFHISYIEGNPQSIPSSEVKGYYIKEAHIFDEGTSTYSTQVEALCPILSGVGDYGELRLPLFWIKYSDLAPYLQSGLIPLSEGNSAYRGTLFDFFRLGLYKGKIVKTENLRGRTLSQEYQSLEAQKKAQEHIERELSDSRRSSISPTARYISRSSLPRRGTSLSPRASLPQIAVPTLPVSHPRHLSLAQREVEATKPTPHIKRQRPLSVVERGRCLIAEDKP